MNREQELINEFLDDLKNETKDPIFTIVKGDGVYRHNAKDRPLWYEKIDDALIIWLNEKHPELFMKG